jgi:hypothetical protein
MSSVSLALPRHWELLVPEDQQEYLMLRAQFHEEILKSRRGERIDVLVQRLKSIRSFINRDVLSQWKRSLVCGIIFLDNALGINIQQLRNLLGKCKSSINGSLQQLSYVAKPSTREIDSEIARSIPVLKNDRAELKKWTIRYGAFPDDSEMVPLIEVTQTLPSPPPRPEEAKDVVKWAFPCPAKCRHKFYDILYISTSIQTEI